MIPAFKKAMFCAAVLILMATAGYGQSLGDVAREQREKQQAKNSQAAPKVITNEDLGEPPDGSPKNASEETKQNDHSSKPLGSKTAEQWKAEIEAQKTAIANLRNRIDKVNSSVRFTQTAHSWNAVRHNERQEQKLDEVQQMQNQLAEEQKKLEQLQESARREGFGSSVYDPN
jgi:predicted RNase H-like nuclease (RuvC/YqgF family)